MFVLVAFAPLLTACGGSSLEPEFSGEHVVPAVVQATLDRSSYRAGDLITVTLANNSVRHYGYNLCGRSFERLIGTDWSAMPPELRLCAAILHSLPSGGVRSGQADLPTDFAPGTYRLLVYLSETTPGGNTSTIAISAPFTVE